MADDLIGARQTRIRSWLEDDGWQVSDTSPTGAVWALAANDNHSFVVVGQSNDKPDQLFVQASVGIDSRSTERMAALGEAHTSQLIWELRFGLLQAGFEFDGVGFPLEGVRLYQRMFLSELSISALLSMVSSVRRGVRFVYWTLERRIWS